MSCLRSARLAYLALAAGVLASLLWPQQWKESLYDTAFEVAGRGWLPLPLAVVGSLLGWCLVPCLPALIAAVVTRKKSSMPSAAYVVGLLALAVVSFRGYMLGKRWQRPFCSGMIRRLSTMATAEQWRAWASTNWALMVLERRVSVLLEGQAPRFATEAFPGTVTYVVFGGSAAEKDRFVGFMWRGTFVARALIVELDEKVRQASEERFIMRWEDGLSVSVGPNL